MAIAFSFFFYICKYAKVILSTLVPVVKETDGRSCLYLLKVLTMKFRIDLWKTVPS